jgi:hypothetical protein
MNITDLQASLDYLFKAEVTPFLWGHAGIGKTSVVKQYAKDKGYHFFAFYLGTQSDLGDVLGLADFVKDENGRSVATAFATPEWLANTIRYCEENPDSGAVIFLDEFNRARKDILSGMFSLALDKTFHTLRLPKNCHLVAAGNPPTDEYFVTDVNETALMARFVHIKLEPTFQEWAQYAAKKGFDSNLITFLREQPELLADAKSDFELPIKVDNRSWERLDKVASVGTPKHLLDQLMTGIVGTTRTVAYHAFLAKSDKPLPGADVLAGIGIDRVTRWSNPDNVMASVLNLTCENVEKEIITREAAGTTVFTDAEKAALMAFISVVPKDIIYKMMKSLSTASSVAAQKQVHNSWGEFIRDPRYATPLYDVMKTAIGKAAA